MKAQLTVKKLVKKIIKEWRLLGLSDICLSKACVLHQQEFVIQANFFLVSRQQVTITATIASGLIETESIYLVFDAIVAKKLPVNELLGSLCAFTQQAGMLLSPLNLILDMKSEQLCLRIAYTLSCDSMISFSNFFDDIKRLTPRLTESLDTIIRIKPKPETARLIAEFMVEETEAQG